MNNPFENHQQELKKLINSYGITYLGLFGSRSRNDYSTSSDYDILYDYEGPLSLLDAAKLQRTFENILNQKVDIISKKHLKPRFKSYIEKDLIKIYEK